MFFLHRCAVPDVITVFFKPLLVHIYSLPPSFSCRFLVLIIAWWVGWCLAFYGNNLVFGLLFLLLFCVRKLVLVFSYFLVLSLFYHLVVFVAVWCNWFLDYPLGMDFPARDFMVPDFFLPRQGPVVYLNPALVQQRNALFSRMVVVVVVDTKNMPVHRLQHIIDANWILLGDVTVRSKHHNFFLLEFSEVEDMEFMLANGPWSVQNCLLILEKWCPNMTINNLKVEGLDLWFKFSGVPFDLICPELAWKLAELIGDPLMIDIWDSHGVSMEGVRVKVRVNPARPMSMGAFITLPNGIVKWVSCTPERVFRICEHCGYIGHLSSECYRSMQFVLDEAARIRDEILDRFEVNFAYANNAPHYVCPRRKSTVFHFRKTTKGEVHFDAFDHHYVIVDKFHVQHLPNILNAEVSSSEGSVYSVIDVEKA